MTNNSSERKHIGKGGFYLAEITGAERYEKQIPLVSNLIY